ncbi:hypothetical protein GJ744_007143 [Endocarpon pusillum]|uniref:Altered inheritance of mitochondria protein 24, mitochondrial n=1 Tax=Endocarpon pusillum TaxID=364733 RepID=A0A8H7E4C3_9EURO|nr:hypothetical protein GJ744_007143 [Endocarpon pusillum]
MRAPASCRFQRLSNHARQSAAASQYIRVADSRRHIQIHAAPSSDSSGVVEQTPGSASTPDAVFEVIGSPYSLLSVTLSASQPLHTRRGTLVGLSGDASTVVSTLSVLAPLRRALVGIPFLYQRLTTTTPITALISPKSTSTSLAVLHLTGTTDWKISQRKALLAWTGNSLVLTPSLNRRLSLAHWGSSTATGRGLVALAGTGNLFSLDLDENETYTAHPSHILAYSVRPPHHQPYRFKSSALNLQIPRLPQQPSSYNFLPFSSSSRLKTNLQNSDSYRFLSALIHRIRAWSRRAIWGDDRLFLRFTGPTTILLQSRASRASSDVFTRRDVEEMHADAPPPGLVADAVKARLAKLEREEGDERPRGGGAGGGGGGGGGSGREVKEAVGRTTVPKPPKLSIATVQRDGKVRIEETEDFEQLRR